MPAKRRNRILLSPSLVISYLASASHAITNDFSAYPAAARSCLYEAADASACTGSTVYQMNLCLCSNTGNFVLGTAACLAANDQDDISSVYSTLVTSCSESNTPLAITRDQFQDAADHGAYSGDDDKSTTASSSTTQTQTTSVTAPPSSTTTTATTITTIKTTTTPATTMSQSMTTYKSVAGGVTVTVTREIQSAPTGTDSGDGDSDSDAQKNNDSNEGDSNHVAIIAGVGGGLAFLVAVLIYLFCHRRMLHRERIGQTGSSGKFAALSSATSLTTMTNIPQNGRPDSALTVPLTHGTAQWNQHQRNQQQQQQQQQGGQVSPLHWQQQNLASPYGQPTATWPTPAASPNEPTGTFGVSPVSHYAAKSSPDVVAHEAHDQDDWDTHPGLGLSPIPAPSPRPLTSSNSNSYSPVFELPGDQTAPVEADSTPIGPVQPSNPSPSTHFHSTQPIQPAPAHHGMPRQVDDALQISQVELPPPRYTGPSSEWIGDSKRLG